MLSFNASPAHALSSLSRVPRCYQKWVDKGPLSTRNVLCNQARPEPDMMPPEGSRAHIHSACFPNFDTVAHTTSAGAESTIDILADTGAKPMPAKCTVVNATSDRGLDIVSQAGILKAVCVTF